MLTLIKFYALFALFSSAFIVWAGYNWQSRKAIKREYDWHMSPVILHEPEPVIRTRPGESVW